MSIAFSWGWGIYRLAAGTADRIPFSGKLADALAGRRHAVQFWTSRPKTRPAGGQVVWFHAASVGEARVVEPVVRRLRTAIRDIECVLTYSSPSVADWHDKLGFDAASFAPPEAPGPVSAVFDAVDPSLLVFSRSDLWPEMMRAAIERRVPIAVIGGVVSRDSSRTRWPVRQFLRRLYPHLGFVGAVSREDRQRWIALGAREDVVQVTGDPRHDQVLEDITDLAGLRSLAPWAKAGPTLVAGSTEPEDEPILLQAFAQVLGTIPAARLLLVPHDPSPEAARRILDRARQFDVEISLADGLEEPRTSCAIVSRKGVLSSLYCLGVLSYVGGGFSSGGVHAVIEPAAFGIPVITGPENGDSREAPALAAKGGAISLPRDGGVRSLAAAWLGWLGNEGERQRAGVIARGALSQGAAGETARRLRSLLPG